MKVTSEEKERFEEKCYEAYKLRWMLEHGCTLTELFKGITDVVGESIEDDPSSIPTTGTDVMEIAEEARDSFVNDIGFCGSMWACMDEFLDMEFKNREYMYSLFSMINDGANMRVFYDENCVEKDDSFNPGEKPYWVIMRLSGRYVPMVMAKDPEEARSKADEAFSDADFGELEDIDGECVAVEDEDDNRVWEKD